MGCLYIGGAQCVHAEFLDDNDWRRFDDAFSTLRALASTFELHANRYKLDDQGAPCFVLTNTSVRKECFYEGAAFETNMSVQVSDTFGTRAQQFIAALNDDAALSAFHGLEWSAPRVLYFVSS